MSRTNCINCGASKEVSDLQCPFCGTSYFDLTDIDLDQRHPCVVRFKFQDHIFQMKAFVGMAEFTYAPITIDITSLEDYWNRRITTNHDVRANIEFICAE